MNFPWKPPFFLDFPVRYDKSPDGNGLFVKPMWFMVLHGGSNEHARLFSAAIPRKMILKLGASWINRWKIHRNGLGLPDKTLEYCITVHTWHTFNYVFALFVLAFFTTVISNGLDGWKGNLPKTLVSNLKLPQIWVSIGFLQIFPPTSNYWDGTCLKDFQSWLLQAQMPLHPEGRNLPSAKLVDVGISWYFQFGQRTLSYSN